MFWAGVKFAAGVFVFLIVIAVIWTVLLELERTKK